MKLTADSPNWPHEPFSLVVERVEENSDSSRWIADVFFVAADAPHDLLEHGRPFELFEGFRCVARGKIDEEAKPPIPKAEQFTRSATIEWIRPEDGGRQTPFEGLRYCAPVKFDGDVDYPQVAFSLVVDRIADRSDMYFWNANVHFLVDAAPHHLLVQDARFELYEGARCTARGVIDVTSQPERWFPRTSLQDNPPQAKTNERVDALPWPWKCAGEERNDLNYEFYRECPDNHVLYGTRVQAIAQDGDDILFRLEGPLFGYAVVHLTWRSGPELGPDFPCTDLYATFQDWVDARMIPDSNL